MSIEFRYVDRVNIVVTKNINTHMATIYRTKKSVHVVFDDQYELEMTDLEPILAKMKELQEENKCHL